MFYTECKCADFRHPSTKIGNCEIPDPLFDDKFSCYINTPASCTDSKLDIGLVKWRSSEACENGNIHLTFTTPNYYIRTSKVLNF